MIAPKDYVYCSGNADRALPPRIVLKKTVHRTKQSCASLASSSHSACSAAGYCESVGH